MRIVSLQEVKEQVTMSAAIAAMRRGFIDLAGERITSPEEFVMQHPACGDIHIKGAHIFGSRWMVTKIAAAGFTVKGNHGCVIGIDAETGKIEVLVDDGGWLTEVRTAAAVALSVDVLARTNANKLAVIGVGVQAQFQIEAVRHVRQISEIAVYGRTAEKVAAFASAHDARACSSVDEAISNADIVLCATTSYAAIITNAKQIRPGVHITASGADMVGKRELSEQVVEAANVVAVDNVALATRVGILQAVREDVAKQSVSIGQLLTGTLGRTSDTQKTVAGLSGLGMQDAAIFELVH
jgi:ornithine cyclodeaminase/alanine dehydrogenase-like protein (mu-crystallin family)